MNKALGLLVEGRLSIKEISFICGFSDDKYFSRIFKNTYGYPPSQLRKNTYM
jgi:two-component system response regulator YesN